MKKRKKKFAWILLEGLSELVIAVICLGIGMLIVSLFGVDFKSPNIDYDLIILLGVVVFLIIFIIVYAFVQWVKKIRH